ncbi:MAG TPA: hypothetical protein VFG87_02100 [Amycolatopsis sp.]|nr:hypothetical protein [Amycolatopsis sp.]
MSFLETLCSAAGGAGVAIGTKTRHGGPATPPGAERTDGSLDRPDGQQVAEPPRPAPEGWVFRQTAWPNPTFIYESAETFEGLIAIDPQAREVREWHGLAVRDVMKEIGETAATVARAPLLTLQCPAQLPTIVKTRNHDLSTRKEIASPCSSLAVRFAIALRDPSAAMRFQLADRVHRLCQKHGFGFWIADTRPGHRPGNWFEICHADGGRSGLYNGDVKSRQRVGTCLPVTFAGPARIEPAFSIVSFLQRYPQVGVVGCAGTSLADVAFVHLLLSVQGVGVDRLNRILRKLLDERTTSARPRKLLQQLFTRLGLKPDPVEGDGEPDPASDYQTFAGPALLCRPWPAPDSLAVWVSWEIARQDDGVVAPLDCLYRALGQVAPKVAEGTPRLNEVSTVEYLICRATEQSVIRGKAKFAVPKSILRHFSAGSAEPAAAQLCVSLEDAWKAQLESSGVDGVSEVTVAWRESWLGHRTHS